MGGPVSAPDDGPARSDGRVRHARRTLAVAWTALALSFAALAPSANAATLPDHRAYEMVTRFTEGGHEVGLNGVETGYGVPSTNGEGVDWLGFGACCGATSGAAEFYQSDRQAGGWQTKTLTPTPNRPLEGLIEEQDPMFFTSDLQQTVWLTPASYAPGDHRPESMDDNDVYLQGPTGALTWLSQGPFGTGSGPYSAEFDGATPDAGEVAFSSAEQLTANATGLTSLLRESPQYLYVRDVADETTTLVDVNNNNELISPYGAALGNGGELTERLAPTDGKGTTTNAISADGTKVFFEAPVPGDSELPEGQYPHLYMRDLANDTTTPLDDPSASSSAQYEGASTNGSLVFFTSSEGLDGAPAAKELYEFNTTSSAIGALPPMSATALTTGAEGILGVSAIANDGSHVYFVAEEALAGNPNPRGDTAVSGRPDLYDYDTASGVTTFVATLGELDIHSCSPTCGTSRETGGLVAEPDVERPLYPTPNGEVLLFGTTADLTGEHPTLATKLTAPASSGEHTLIVESTAGFEPDDYIAIGSGPAEEYYRIEVVDSPTELTLSEYGPSYENGLSENQPAEAPIAELDIEYYRYSSAEDSLVCVTCTAPGVFPTGSADLGASGGGTYAPPGETLPMTEDGSKIFFDSPDALVPEAQMAPPGLSARPPSNVYEWEDGHVSLISDGSTLNAALDGTTPSGNDVFFATRAQLLPSEPNDDYMEIYDARVNGGFPVTGSEPPPCEAGDCRIASSGGTRFSAVPGSALLGDGGVDAPQSLAAPTYTVAALTTGQRRRLARTGALTLTVTATAPGEVLASVEARVRHKKQRVAHAEATLGKPGAVELTLDLSKAARAQLAKSKTLALQIEVSYSESATVELAALTVHVPTSPTIATRSATHHA